MNDKQGTDWGEMVVDPKTKTTKKMHLCALQEKLKETSEKEPTKRQELQQAIDRLHDQQTRWLYNRRERYARKNTGIASDYETIQIPPEEEQDFWRARFVEYDGETLTYDTRPAYIIEGSKVICTSGWVCGDERLLDDYVVDFSDIEIEEPLYFQLWYAKDVQTMTISVQLLIRNEDEEFAEFPQNLIKREYKHGPMCQGRVNLDKSITLGRF